ncbi:MAG: hypothetical protein M1819_007271 [Sarea resinae]|nr:MAG: hypothetical protein M1819_007271 [Sarea resinae]
MNLQRERTLCPITALSFILLRDNQLLLAGEGNTLRLYDRALGSCVAERRVFRNQIIHGIKVDESAIADRGFVSEFKTVLVWGGRSVKFLQLHRSQGSVSSDVHLTDLSGEIVSPDWILDGTFDTSNLDCTDHHRTGFQAFLVTAHNALLKVRCDCTTSTQEQGQPAVEELVCGSRSILYSAQVLLLSSMHVLIASGTVFGDVLVWSCYLDVGTSSVNGKARKSVHYRFTGHEGSVFGVAISRIFTASPKLLLASCSDDRSIRVWDISRCTSPRIALLPTSDSDVHIARETGFGGVDSQEARSNQDSDRCIAVAWGHSSRIWGCRFISCHESESVPMLVSFGEDATLQSWALTDLSIIDQDQDKLRGRLQHLRTSHVHSGKNLWSIDLAQTADGSTLVASGGADGRIAICTVSPPSAISRPPAELQKGRRASTVSKVLPFDEISLKDSHFQQPHDTLDDSRQDGRLAHQADHITILGETTLSDSQGAQDRGLVGATAVLQENSPRKTKSKKEKESFKSYAFVNKCTCIATTRSGAILLVTPCRSSLDWNIAIAPESEEVLESDGNESKVSVSKIADLEDIGSYSVITSVPSSKLAFLAGSSAKVYLYDHHSGSFAPLMNVGSKVAGLFSRSISEDTVDLLVTCVGHTVAYHFSVYRDKSQDGSPCVRFKRLRELELPVSFIVTSLEIDLPAGCMLLGARNGSLAIYPYPDNIGQEISRLVPIDYVKSLHGGDAITVIKRISGLISPYESPPGYYLTAGRDGTYCIHRLTRVFNRSRHTIANYNFVTVHISSPPLGPNIEGAYFVASSNELVLYGFRSTQFVVWNESTRTELITIECGGAHRSWAYSIDHQGQYGWNNFLWTQASQLHIHSSRSRSLDVVQSGGHGREIKAAAVSPSLYDGTDKSCRFLATGSEDTAIRIFSYETILNTHSTQGFHCLGVFNKHRTGIQHLQWSDKGDYLFSSGGRNELFAWRVRTLPGRGIGMVCEAFCPPDSEISDLRIMSFDVSRIEGPESESGHVESQFLITMVYSDSTVRCYAYVSGPKQTLFHLVFSGTYMTSCLTQVRHYISDAEIWAIVASTDGHISLWNLTAPLAKRSIVVRGGQLFGSSGGLVSTTIYWQKRIHIHQNSIKSTLELKVEDGYFILVTGGDDNSLALTCIILTGEGPVHSTLLIPKAHASAINAAALIPSSLDHTSNRSRQYNIVTSGNDQQLKVWSITVDTERQGVEMFSIRQIGDEFTAIADISSVDVLQTVSGDRILICGVGMETWAV